MPVSQVSNMDIAGLCDRTTVFARELISSQSAFNGGFFLENDRARLVTYLDRLEAFAQAANSQPLDLQNQDVKDVIRRFKAIWVEMSESQSADLASGINRFDLARFQSVVESCRALLAMSGESIDLPENRGNVPVPSGTASRPTGSY
jgi:sigma54-dependent transcription regulator